PRRWGIDGGGVANPIGPHWASDVLDLLLPEILEREAELVSHLVADDPADANAAGLRQRFQPRGDVHPIPKTAVSLTDHLAEIDAKAEAKPPLLGHLGLAVGHAALDLGRTPDGVHHAGKLCQQTIASVLYGVAPVLLDLWLDQLPEVRLEPLVRPFLIRPH